jgi:hypothetical protein
LDIAIFFNSQKQYTKSCVEKVTFPLKGVKHQVINGKKRLHSKTDYFEKGNEFKIVIDSALLPIITNNFSPLYAALSLRNLILSVKSL